MGVFYANYTVKPSDQASVVRAMAKRSAFVSPVEMGALVVYDQASDQQDEKGIGQLAAYLANELRCTVLASLVHDSDVFCFQLHQPGKLIDAYNSAPDYWSPKGEPSPPSGGDSRRLCAATGCTEPARVEDILRAPWSQYPDAMDRHADLVRALGLPPISVGYGFASILRGDLPKGIAPGAMIRTPSVPS